MQQPSYAHGITSTPLLATVLIVSGRCTMLSLIVAIAPGESTTPELFPHIMLFVIIGEPLNISNPPPPLSALFPTIVTLFRTAL